MSPEQKISSTNVDQTTDIYAIGVIIYEILTGKKPAGRFKLPSELDSSLGPAYDEIVQSCLAQDAKDRYQSANDLKNAILDVIGGAAKQASDFAVGGVESFIGKCRYLDTIMDSKFGSTILVENEINKKLYVIKRYNKGEVGRKEAKLLSSLKHRNIVNILGSGGDAKQTVVISEYAPGGSLADRMVRKYPWGKAMHIVLQIAAGMDFAHKNNIVHGDLRPSNVLFDSQDEVKITDFGMPGHYDNPKKKNWYAAPENKQSKQGDIYAAGVILHQMIVGRNPAYDTAGTLRLDDVKADLPDDVASILKKMLALRVTHRYTTYGELLLDWDDSEKRRQDERRRLQQAPAASVETSRQIPVWMWAAGVAGVLGVVALILYFAGVFR